MKGLFNMAAPLEYKLPSNRKFGSFFTLVFTVAAVYFFYSGKETLAHSFVLVASTFLIVTSFKSEFLLPLNKLWMRFGLLLGMLIGPVVLGIIFFGIFAPIAILIRLSGRDELRLKITQKATYWILRTEPIKSESFKHQF